MTNTNSERHLYTPESCHQCCQCGWVCEWHSEIYSGKGHDDCARQWKEHAQVSEDFVQYDERGDVAIRLRGLRERWAVYRDEPCPHVIARLSRWGCDECALEFFRRELFLLRECEQALRAIIEIGKRDMSNPKYDGYFETAKTALGMVEGRK